MYFKIEPSGCCERNGLMQVRYLFFLEPGDHGHERHRVTVPVIPPEGYAGQDDDAAFDAWLKALPTETRENPFHNHFIYVDPAVDDAYLESEGERLLQEAYALWQAEKPMAIRNPTPEWNPHPERQAAVESRLAALRLTLKSAPR